MNMINQCCAVKIVVVTTGISFDFLIQMVFHLNDYKLLIQENESYLHFDYVTQYVQVYDVFGNQVLDRVKSRKKAKRRRKLKT